VYYPPFYGLSHRSNLTRILVPKIVLEEDQSIWHSKAAPA
jgi:hypothetical protein